MPRKPRYSREWHENQETERHAGGNLRFPVACYIAAMLVLILGGVVKLIVLF